MRKSKMILIASIVLVWMVYIGICISHSALLSVPITKHFQVHDVFIIVLPMISMLGLMMENRKNKKGEKNG